jgi:hypothetical protein
MQLQGISVGINNHATMYFEKKDAMKFFQRMSLLDLL